MDTYEKKRVEALRSYDILYTDGSPDFDELAELAAFVCNTPYALINFIDEDQQKSLSACGVNPENVDRKDSLCNYTIQQEKELIIENARRDPRFKDNLFVTGDAQLQFYAGVIVKSQDGFNIGTVCVYDDTPHSISDEQLQALHKIARQVERQLELRTNNRQL